MPINTNLLVAAPMLQDYLVDKDTGFPLAGGIISLYEDDERSLYKNWYYQTGSPGVYTWVTLDNPLRLSSVGTIQDPNGNDVIPFYYPYDEDDDTIKEAYYITVYSVDSNGNPAVLQFTRENFPFSGSGNTPVSTSPTWRNYILNNVYWRNAGTQTIASDSDVLDVVIAPSQHDGYTNPDIRYIKSKNGATDTLTFKSTLANGITLTNDITPEYYINMKCTGSTDGETQKCIQYPVSLHVETLNSVTGVIKFHAQNVAGNPNNYVDLYFYQFTGTGSTSPARTLIKHIVLNNNFSLYSVPFTTPNTASTITLGKGGDDALFFQVEFPLNKTFEINHTKPQLYLSTDYPENDFDTYDQIETIINSPRTGDYRTSMNDFVPFGWVASNDGVISNSGTFTLPTGVISARQNIDTWPLFNLLWKNTNAVFTPIYDSAGMLSSRGADAITDWSANKQLQLTLALGRSLLGLPPAVSVTYDRTAIAPTPAWATVAGVFTMATGATLLYVGSPVYLTGTMPAGGNFTANTIYYAIPATDGSSTTQFQLASSYANALAGTAIAAGAASDNGTSLVVNWALGGAFGESRHVLTVKELAAHVHSGTALVGGSTVLDGPNNITFGSDSVDANFNVPMQVASDGSNYPHANIQPSFYANVFLKL